MTLQKQVGTFHSSKHSFLYLGRYNSIRVPNTPPPPPVRSGNAFDVQGIQTVGYLLALRQSTALVNDHQKQSNL